MSIGVNSAVIWGIDIKPIEKQLPDNWAEALEECGLDVKADGMCGAWAHAGFVLSDIDIYDECPTFISDLNTFVLERSFITAIKESTKLSLWVKDLILQCPRGLYHFIYYS